MSYIRPFRRYARSQNVRFFLPYRFTRKWGPRAPAAAKARYRRFAMAARKRGF